MPSASILIDLTVAPAEASCVTVCGERVPGKTVSSNSPGTLLELQDAEVFPDTARRASPTRRQQLSGFQRLDPQGPRCEPQPFARLALAASSQVGEKEFGKTAHKTIGQTKRPVDYTHS